MPTWVSNVIHHEALLHATLGHSAQIFAFQRGLTSSPEALYHLGEAFSLINQSLANPTDRASDGTIGTVLALLLQDVRTHAIMLGICSEMELISVIVMTVTGF
jgi:hypothetical protein